MRASAQTYKAIILAGKVTRADIDKTPAYSAPKANCN
jgi:hypothetical protein